MYPAGLDKGRGSKFHVGLPSSTRNTWRRPEDISAGIYGYNNKDEDNCLKALNDKNSWTQFEQYSIWMYFQRGDRFKLCINIKTVCCPEFSKKFGQQKEVIDLCWDSRSTRMIIPVSRERKTLIHMPTQWITTIFLYIARGNLRPVLI